MNISTRSLLAAVTLVLMTIGFLPRSVAAAPCVTVTPDGSRRCYTTIQAAVNAAPNGATLNISPGTYIEQVNIHEKTLTINGNGATVRVPAITHVNMNFGEQANQRSLASPIRRWTFATWS